MEYKMTIIAIVNQKGGVGKTTTAVTLASGLARMEIPTLLIDLDAQGNVADSLGMESDGSLMRWIAEELPLSKVVSFGRENLDVVRSDKRTALLKNMLAGMNFRENVLKGRLEHKDAEKYEVIVMDCAPSVDILHTAALVAADHLIIPAKLDQLAIKGIVETLHSLAAVHMAKRSDCKVMGILPTFYDKVTNETEAQFKNLAEAYKALVWPPIPTDTKCRMAPRDGKTLWEMGGKSKARDMYVEMIKRVLEKVREK
jgi:chromosome partitioning protein